MSDLHRLEEQLKQSPDALARHHEIMAWIHAHRKAARIKTFFPESPFPELDITVPDTWESVILAPLYDVHMGHEEHDAEMFDKHLRWIKETPNVLTWNGGDMIENASKVSVGAGVYQQKESPNKQLIRSLYKLAPIAHKLLFSIPGNHEARTDQMGFSVASWMALCLEVPYFPDYCFCSINWRGNRFRILAHHGTGASQTAGAQRMAARKDISWAKPFDLFWTGHLHNGFVDILHQTDQDQRTGRMHERNGLIVLSRSYLHYFGTYAASSRMPPGGRGLIAATLRPDGRIDASVHANGKRL